MTSLSRLNSLILQKLGKTLKSRTVHSNLKFRPDLDALFRYSSGYWLCNDKEHRDARSVAFNVAAFCQLAAEAVGANAVTDMVKINESVNRVFLLRFDSGREAIARFPTSLAGPPHFTTASEVATIDFLRRRLGLQIPPILAWSSHAKGTDVGAEFILMEKASGCLLSDVWDDLSPRVQAGFAQILGKCKRQLLDLNFTHYGSLYYTNDIPASLRAPTLLEGISSSDELNSTFCIGPIARRDFWEAERGNVDIDRGPWRTAEEYMIAVARREQEWITRFGTSHLLDDPNCILPGQRNRDEHVEFLSTYITLAPILTPHLFQQIRPVMWHPDLHASNIFVKLSEVPGKIAPAIPLSVSSIIDWQGTWIGPAFLQLQIPLLYRADSVPLGLQIPTLPDNFEELGEGEKAEVKDIHRRRICHKVFEVTAFPASIFNMKARQELIYLEDLAQATWKCGMIPFHMALLNVYERWGDFFPDETCPIEYPLEDLDSLHAHHDMWTSHQKLLEDMNREFGLAECGYVKGDRDHLDKVKLAVEQKKQAYIEGGSDDEAKQVRSLLWPYRDMLRDHDVIPQLILPSVSVDSRFLGVVDLRASTFIAFFLSKSRSNLSDA